MFLGLVEKYCAMQFQKTSLCRACVNCAKKGLSDTPMSATNAQMLKTKTKKTLTQGEITTWELAKKERIDFFRT